MAPDGSMVVGVNSTYAFEIRRPDGAVTRVEREAEPVPIGDDERGHHEAARERLIEGGQDVPPIPRVKPFYRDLFVDWEGNVWVHLHAESEIVVREVSTPMGLRPGRFLQEANLLDVFESDGTYLGRVHAPADVTLEHLGLDGLWGTVLGEYGEVYVVRLELGPPPA